MGTDRVLPDPTPFIHLHLTELYVGGLVPEGGLSHRVAVRVTDADRLVLASEGQQAPFAPRAARYALCVLPQDRDLPTNNASCFVSGLLPSSQRFLRYCTYIERHSGHPICKIIAVRDET